MNTIETISNAPFRHLISTIGELPTSFTESMSYYEMLAWLCDFIEKKIIPTVNNNAEVIKELQDLFVELKSYVDHYFDNLDVQEEINNKLDAMVEDGTLAEIINQEIFGELSDKVDENTANITTAETNIDKKINGFKLNLMRNCIIDLGTNSLSNNYTQGSCMIGNKLYIMQPTTGDNGNMIVLDVENKSYHGSVSDVQMWHGADAGLVGSNIYIAPGDTSAGRKLVVFNTLNDTTSQITPFETVSNKNAIISCANYDTNKLLCVLDDVEYGYYQVSDLSERQYCIYNTTTGEVTDLTFTNPKGLSFSSVTGIQSTACIGNHLYLMSMLDNNLLDFYIDEENETISPCNIYNLPYYDNSGLLVGEYEGISNAPLFGENALMITTHVTDNESTGTRTVKCYVVNPIDGTPNFELKSSTDIDTEAISFQICVDAGSTSLYEDGTPAYPYKSIKRGIAAATSGKNMRAKFGSISLKSSAQHTYYAGDIMNIPNLDINFDDSHQHIVHIRRIVGSQVSIQKNPDYGAGGVNCGRVYFDAYNIGDTYGQIKNSEVRLDDVDITVAGVQLACFTSQLQLSNIHTVTCVGDRFIYAAKNNVIFDGCPKPTFQGNGTHISYYMVNSSKLIVGNASYTASDVGTLDSGKLIQAWLETCTVILPGLYTSE